MFSTQKCLLHHLCVPDTCRPLRGRSPPLIVTDFLCNWQLRGAPGAWGYTSRYYCALQISAPPFQSDYLATTSCCVTWCTRGDNGVAPHSHCIKLEVGVFVADITSLLLPRSSWWMVANLVFDLVVSCICCKYWTSKMRGNSRPS